MYFARRYVGYEPGSKTFPLSPVSSLLVIVPVERENSHDDFHVELVIVSGFSYL